MCFQDRLYKNSKSMKASRRIRVNLVRDMHKLWNSAKMAASDWLCDFARSKLQGKRISAHELYMNVESFQTKPIIFSRHCKKITWLSSLTWKHKTQANFLTNWMQRCREKEYLHMNNQSSKSFETKLILFLKAFLQKMTLLTSLTWKHKLLLRQRHQNTASFEINSPARFEIRICKEVYWFQNSII